MIEPEAAVGASSLELACGLNGRTRQKVSTRRREGEDTVAVQCGKNYGPGSEPRRCRADRKEAISVWRKLAWRRSEAWGIEGDKPGRRGGAGVCMTAGEKAQSFKESQKEKQESQDTTGAFLFISVSCAAGPRDA